VSDSIAGLAARAAITEVLHRYCRAVDRLDRDLGLSCWHDGATVDYGDTFRGTAADLIDWVCTIHEQLMAAHSHQVTNVLARIDGDRATSESYVTVALRTKGDDPTDIESRGRYLDRWSCRNGIWAIDHRRLVTDLSSARPSAPTTEPAAGARRDESDPSYELFERGRPSG
jgi:hypothetical protein